MAAKLKTAVVGASGYSGFELARLLLRHPRVDKPLLLRRQSDGDGAANLAEMFPAISGNGGYPVETFAWSLLQQRGVDLLFFRHTARNLAHFGA